MAAHSHDHAHAGHSHSPGHSHASHAHPTLHPSVLGWAMVATLGLVVAEVFGGVLGRSVALLNDAVHNLSDVPALGISYLAMRWAERPADSEKTYGYHRAGTLAAFTNAFVLILLSLWLGYEAFERFRSPVVVVESWMIWTSVGALAVNGGITLALVRGRGDLNLRSILVHNFGDALSNIAIIAGALIIHATGAHWIDPLLGLAIGLLVLWSSIGILRESSHILLEGRPLDLQVEEVARAILKIEGVQEVHDVHLWSLGGAHNALSLHARIPFNRTAQTLAGHVAQRAVFPGIGYRKKYRSVPPHKNKFVVTGRPSVGRLNCRRRCWRSRLQGGSVPAASLTALRLRSVLLGSVRRRIFFYSRARSRQDKSTIKKRKKQWNLQPTTPRIH